MRNATAVEMEHSSMRTDPNELSTCTGEIYMTAQSNMLQQNIRKRRQKVTKSGNDQNELEKQEG